MNNVFMQIPVIQRVRKQDSEEEELRAVMELVSPSFIVRVSPTASGTCVLWLAHNVPYMETPMSYDEVLSLLQNLQVEQNDDELEEDSD